MTARHRPPPPNSADAYFFDVDGTLAEIVAGPADARVDDELRRRLTSLREATGGAVAIVSGRSIDDVDALFPHERYPVAGQHGSERRSAAGVVDAGGLEPKRMSWLRAAAARAIGSLEGVAVEDKGGSLAFHYRRAPRLAAFVHRTARSLAAAAHGEVGVQTGKRVVELLPAGRDKGQAVKAFMAERPFRGRRPVFVGDDVTDESAFLYVNRMSGISVKVGEGRTAAIFRLSDVSAVREWLAELE
jgi:trehalose 6-phosphate phosphatase